MVVNTNMILDEGQNKYVAECKMVKVSIARKFKRSWDKNIPTWVIDDNLERTKKMIPNPDYVEPNRKLNLFLNKYYYQSPLTDCWLMETEWSRKYDEDEELIQEIFTKKEMCEHLGVIPFNPCVMINISPNWKGKVDPKDEGYQGLLATTIQTYFNACNRYSKYRYCIECGGEGNFLHAHIVAEINPDLHKSVMTHINKGNHKYELIKAWKKLKGDEGLLKGKFAIQRILINNENMRDDKLAYLEEKNKPDGHQNAYDLNIVLGDF